MSIRRLLRPVLGAAALSIALAGGVVAAPAGAATVPAITPNVTSCNHLTGVAALSASSAWAVGSSCTSTGAERTLTMRWNGRAWSVVKSPNVGNYGSALQKVVALSPTNVWAVGSYRKDRGTFRTLVLHWNGTAWRVVASPNSGTGSSVLTDITALSPTNIWAVGYWSSNTGGGAVAMRWNGSMWRISPTPAGRFYELSGVSAASASDIWAVGTRIATTGQVATLAMHWNGRAWGVVPMPNAGTRKNNFLFGGVRVVSARDAWAVGGYNAGDERVPVFRTLVLRWNGTRWSVVPSPNRGDSNLYGGVTSTSATDVWAVGKGGRGTLVQRWNGRSWSIVSSPSPGTRSNELSDVASASPSAVFAVGMRSTAPSNAYTLVLRWSGTRWGVM